MEASTNLEDDDLFDFDSGHMRGLFAFIIARS